MMLRSSKKLYISLPVLIKESRLKKSAVLDALIFKDKLYRRHTIEKQSGGKRTISIPAPTLARLQKVIAQRITNTIESPDCVHGFVKGKSILTNASAHLKNSHFIKMDLKNFFDAVKIEHVSQTLESHIRGKDTIPMIEMACFLNEGLPQGASSSPVLSNLAANKLDILMSEFSESNNLIYTRYADDITISGKNISFEKFNEAKSLVASTGFEINSKKSYLINSGRKVIVTGISIGSGKMHLPRLQKRELRKNAHFLLMKGPLLESSYKKPFDPFYIDRILGKLSFWAMIEPENDFPKRISQQIQNNARLSGYLN